MTASAAIWGSIRDVSRSRPMARSAPGRCGGSSVRRPRAARLGQALARDTGGDVIYDWGGGLIWAALPPKPDAQAGAGAPARRRRRRSCHAAARLRGDPGHARCVSSAARRAWRTLSERVRHSFDPKNILNRGRMRRAAI